MSKKSKLIICCICIVFFVASIVGFVFGMKNNKVVLKNDKSKTPIVIMQEITVTSKYNLLTQSYNTYLDGVVYNLTEEDVECEIVVVVTTDVFNNKGNLSINWQTIAGNQEFSIKRTFTGTNVKYENVEKVIIKFRTGSSYDAPRYNAESEMPFYVIPSIIIMVISGVSFSAVLSMKDKQYEDFDLDVDPNPIIINTPPEENKDKENDLNDLIECEYCGAINKLGDKKCFSCGANLRKKVNKK